MGANTLAGSLLEYTVCPAGKALQYVDNSCIDCPSGQVYVLAAGLCACDIGYAKSAAAGPDLCGEGLPGSFTVEVGALGSELYSPGNSKMRLLPHRVSIAQRSSILRQRVVPNAQCFHAIYGSLQFSHSLAPFGILASRCVVVGRSRCVLVQHSPQGRLFENCLTGSLQRLCAQCAPERIWMQTKMESSQRPTQVNPALVGLLGSGCSETALALAFLA